MSAALLAVAVALPAVAGILLLVVGALGGSRRTERIGAPIGIAVAALALVAAILAALGRARLELPFLTARGAGATELRVDALAAPVLPLVAVIALLVLVFATGDATRPAGRFHGLMLLFSAAVAVTVTATDLAVLLFAWEVMGATSYALIGFRWREPARVEGGMVAFLVTRTGDLGLYLAAGAALAAGTGWRLDALPDAQGPWLAVLAAGILAAGLGKAAQLPFSFWISRAMAGPSAVSALLHSAAMVAMGGYLLLRMSPLLAASGWAAPVAAWTGAATAIALGVVALFQTDLKQLLAASTAAQLGFVVLAAGVGGTTGGTLQLIAHAATKALLFLVAGAWLTAVGTKEFAGLRGIARRWPVVGLVGTAGALSLAGIPPLSLWAAKDTVLAAALEQNPALYAAGLVGAALSAAYSGRMLALLWRPASRGIGGSGRDGAPEQHWDTEEKGTRRVSALAVAPMLVLAIAALGLGVLALPGPRSALGLAGDVEPAWPELLASAALAVVILLLALVRPPRPWALALDWFGMERAARRVLAAPTLRLADRLAAADDAFARLLDGGNTVLLRSAAVSARVDDAGAVGTVRRVARTTSALGTAARRSQTGNLYQYYLAAVVLLALAVLLLIVVR
ncbi:MAG: NADH-quinone oxidoreductase subunit L [Micrococcales bacterium]|nr:NADH-quinone oxidoreductase subunit L [Micrococcales bacterium]